MRFGFSLRGWFGESRSTQAAPKGNFDLAPPGVRRGPMRQLRVDWRRCVAVVFCAVVAIARLYLAFALNRWERRAELEAMPTLIQTNSPPNQRFLPGDLEIDFWVDRKRSRETTVRQA